MTIDDIAQPRMFTEDTSVSNPSDFLDEKQNVINSELQNWLMADS